MKPIFCGNLDFDSRQSDIERLFRRYGKVDKVDIKSGKIFFQLNIFQDYINNFNCIIDVVVEREFSYLFSPCGLNFNPYWVIQALNFL